MLVCPDNIAILELDTTARFAFFVPCFETRYPMGAFRERRGDHEYNESTTFWWGCVAYDIARV